MGKGLLIIVSAFVVAASVTVLAGKGTATETREELSSYENKVIARDAAESGLSAGISKIERELLDSDVTLDGSMSAADYEVRLEPAMYGDIAVESVGELHEARHEIKANVIFEVPLDAAATLSSDSVVLSLAGSGGLISGHDRRSPTRAGNGTTPGFLSPTYGIRTKSGHDGLVKDQIQDLGATAKVVGSGGDASVAGSFDAVFSEDLYDEAMAAAVAGKSYVQEHYGETTLNLGGGGYGSLSDPRIVVVNGDAKLAGNGTGYGLLLVNDGNLTSLSNDARWEGLVFVRNNTSVDVDLTAGGSIYGGLMAFEYNAASSIEECTPDFEISGDETLVNEAFRVRIQVLGAAISMGAGGYDMPVTAQLKIGDTTVEPWGEYDLPLDGNVNRDGTFVYEPDQIFPPGSIKVNARSWARKSGYQRVWQCKKNWRGREECGWVYKQYDGSENDHWTIHMEKDSDRIDNQLEVLEDDSSVPKISGFDGQTSAAEFVADYIEDGRMKLDKNQSIYLFELGVNDPRSAAHDFQDMVVIVTMVPANASGCSGVPTASNPKLELKMANGATLHYSAEAIAKLGKRLDTIRNRTRVVVAEQRASSN